MYKYCVSFLALLAAVSVESVDAGLISYDYTTTLSLSSGTDDAGLDGATLAVHMTVDSSSVYSDLYGYPAVIMNNDATVTISGASQATNNGTFQLPLYAFYPTYAGMFGHPSGTDTGITLPVGGYLTLSLSTDPSTTGATVIEGQTVAVEDFAPATSKGFNWTAGTSSYTQINPTITASASTVPEPSSLALLGLGAIGLALVRRRTAA